MAYSYKTIGWLMILAAVAILVPYTILTLIFDYPDILRQDTGTILTKFNAGGRSLIWTWFAFAITGLPLVPAYIMLGQNLEAKVPMVRIATSIGITGLVVQLVGLLRWTFVVPILAREFVAHTDAAGRAATIVSFNAIHQFAGVLLGEHLGQLCTIIWTILMAISFVKLPLFPKWVSWLGIISALVYLQAQAELFATVLPGFPTWEMAGFLGSMLWLGWLIISGIFLIRITKTA